MVFLIAVSLLLSVVAAKEEQFIRRETAHSLKNDDVPNAADADPIYKKYAMAVSPHGATPQLSGMSLEGDDEEADAEADKEALEFSGPACPGQDNLIQEYEAECEYLRDKAPLGFTLTIDLLEEHASLARGLRNTINYEKEVPKDIYFAWVLPYRLLHEQAELWRRPFRKFFYSIVTEKSSMIGVVKAVVPQLWLLRANADFAKWLPAPYTNVTFQSQLVFAQDSPNINVISETHQQGNASSLGLSIFAAAALRSLGVPARVVGVERWATKQGGSYYWVEFWERRDPTTGFDYWSFFDADPTAADVLINAAWFCPTFTRVSRKGLAGKILAGTYSRDLPDETIVIHTPGQPDISVPAIDVTNDYHRFNMVTTSTTKSYGVDPNAIQNAMEHLDRLP